MRRGADELDPADSAAESRTRWTPRAWLLVVSLVPAGVFFALGVRAVEPINGQDGYLYTGIAARTTDFLTRFPDSYYGVRFGHIIPTWAFTRLFGLEPGHLLWRFLLLGLICVLLATAVPRRPAQALLAAVIVCTSPVVLVAAFNTYTLSTGVLTFVAASLVLAVAPSWTRPLGWPCVAAGALFAVSWNSNFVVLSLCLVVVGAFLVDHYRSAPAMPLRQTAIRGCQIALGMLAVVLPAMLLYGLRFDIWNIFAPTLAQAVSSTDEGFLEPGVEWVSWRHYLLLGPLAMVVTISVWLTETGVALRGVLRRLAFFAGGSLLLFSVFEWVLDTPLLSLYFYSALPLALCTVALALSVGVAIGRAPEKIVVPLALGAAALTIGSAVLGSHVGASFTWISLASLAGTVFVVIGTRTTTSVLLGGIVSVLIIASWAVVSSPHDFRATPGGYRTDPWYDDVLFTYDRSSMDRLVILDEMARVLPSLPGESGEIAVWFDSLGPYDQLTAPFLWFCSALQSVGDPPMPTLTPTVQERILSSQPRYILVVDGDEADTLLGVEVVTSLDAYTMVWSRPFERGEWEAHVALLERSDGNWNEELTPYIGDASQCPGPD